jgi:hypothetical protein
MSAAPAVRSLVRAAVFGWYGTSCWCCAAVEDLTIDHVNGGGGEHRAALFGNAHESFRFYLWLIDQGFPEDYQTLCRPCNASKAGGPACRLTHDGLLRCWDCRRSKDPGEFRKPGSNCDECNRKAVARWKAANPDKVRAQEERARKRRRAAYLPATPVLPAGGR